MRQNIFSNVPMQTKLFPGEDGARRAFRHALGQSLVTTLVAAVMHWCSRGPAAHLVFDLLVALM